MLIGYLNVERQISTHSFLRACVFLCCAAADIYAMLRRIVDGHLMDIEHWRNDIWLAKSAGGDLVPATI